MPGRVAGCGGAARGVAAVLAIGQIERGLESGEGLDRRVAARALVDGHDRLAALGVADGHGRDLGVEAAAVDRRDRVLVAAQRERVLVLAADLLVDRDALGVRAHVALLDGAPQTVVHRRVDELAVAQPHSRSWRLWQE